MIFQEQRNCDWWELRLLFI